MHKKTKMRGASLTGYGLVVGLIAILAIAAVSNVGDGVNSMFQETSDVISSSGADSSGASSSGGSSSGGSSGADTTAPGLTTITAPPDNGYGPGDTLSFVFSYDEAVEVSGGTPYLQITIESTVVQVPLTGGAGTTELTFSYTVTSGFNDFDGITITSPIQDDGASMADATGNEIDRSFTPPDLSGVFVLDTITIPTIPAIDGWAGHDIISDPVTVGTSGGVRGITPGPGLEISTDFGSATSPTFTSNPNSVTVGDGSQIWMRATAPSLGVTETFTIEHGGATVTTWDVTGAALAGTDTTNYRVRDISDDADAAGDHIGDLIPRQVGVRLVLNDFTDYKDACVEFGLSMVAADALPPPDNNGCHPTDFPSPSITVTDECNMSHDFFTDTSGAGNGQVLDFNFPGGHIHMPASSLSNILYDFDCPATNVGSFFAPNNCTRTIFTQDIDVLDEGHFLGCAALKN